MIKALFRSDLHWITFYLLIFFSWVAVVGLSSETTAPEPFQSIYGPDFWIGLCRQAVGFEDWTLLFAAWAIMSIAMMMPTLFPTLNTYNDLIIGGAGNSRGFYLILVGFLFVWFGFSIIFSTLQAYLLEESLVDQTGVFRNKGLAALFLLIAGLYQFTPLKDNCVSQCRSPLIFFMEYWDSSSFGSVKMGLRLGMICLGCCWALMSLAFVGGTMSFGFMGLATCLMIIEKMPQLGGYVTKPLGAGLICAAAITALGVF